MDKLQKMAKSNEIDMLHGPLFMKILMFSLPLAASSVLQQIFNSVDVAVVGHFASKQALAAVGSNGPVISLLINLFIGVSMGANVIISNHIGQNDADGIRESIRTIEMVSVLSGIILMVIGIATARPILTLMGTPDDVLPMAISYLQIYFLSIPFFLIFNFGAAILRSQCHAKSFLCNSFENGRGRCSHSYGHCKCNKRPANHTSAAKGERAIQNTH